MMVFLCIASLMALLVAWLLVSPAIGATTIARREKIRILTIAGVLLIVFPWIFYFFFAH